jgi:tetratricopeptide (TPR) repeat protein
MDVLRVQTSPQDAEYAEWLTYEFIDRQPSETTLALKWEEKMLPFKISVPSINELYVNRFEEELTGSAGFVSQNWQAAVNWSIQNDYALEKALGWAEQAISAPFFGVENFGSLSTKANVLNKLDRADEAKVVMDKALSHPSTTVLQIHQYGRQLIGRGDLDGALEVFKMNAKRFPKTWPINVGLARGYSAKGEYKTALKHAKLAYAAAPDKLNKDALKAAVDSLEKGEAM